MMGITHFTIGLATSLAVMQPTSINGCLTAVIAGALGGVTPDNDMLDQDNGLKVQFRALQVTAGMLGLDIISGSGICESIISNQTTSIIGLVGFLILWFLGRISDHRTFTHSFLAMMLYSLFIGFIYEPLAIGYMAAYLSHLVLDMLNKKKVPLLYPLDGGICLKLCYANSTVDTVLMYIGYVISAILLIIGIISSVMPH
jgi:inner membrane protein